MQPQFQTPTRLSQLLSLHAIRIHRHVAFEITIQQPRVLLLVRVQFPLYLAPLGPVHACSLKTEKLRILGECLDDVWSDFYLGENRLHLRNEGLLTGVAALPAGVPAFAVCASVVDMPLVRTCCDGAAALAADHDAPQSVGSSFGTIAVPIAFESCLYRIEQGGRD